MKHIPIFVFIVFAAFTPAVIGDDKVVKIIKDSTSKLLLLNVDQSLNSLRSILIGTGFISDDRHRNKWRFVLPSPNANEVLISEDEIIGKKSERVVKIKECLNTENEINLNNVDAKPDLRGFKMDSFSDRQIDVSVALNSQHSQDKFQPLMLKHVRNDGSMYWTYDNVVVCEEDSLIEFKIVARNVSGFGFSIKPHTGDYIATRMFATSTASNGLATIVRRYQSNGQNIKVVSAESPDITLSELVKRQHITITVWKLISFKEGGKTTTYAGLGTEAIQQDITISAGDNKFGQAVPDGNGSAEKFGTICDVKDDTTHVLGQIELDFFIFNSKEAARHVFGATQ